MGNQLLSRNFGFLQKYDPLLVEYGVRAEVYAYTDPNASLIKSRQFGETLARSVCREAGMDPAELSFERCVGLLRRQDIVSGEISQLFTHLRLAGNTAAHQNENSQTTALRSLITAHSLATWFVQNVWTSQSVDVSAFSPPPSPKNAVDELRDEIAHLHKTAAKLELDATASEAERKDVQDRLKREAAKYQEELNQQAVGIRERDEVITRLERKSAERLKAIPTKVDGQLKSFIARTGASKTRLGQSNDDTLPITQLRIMSRQVSDCCKEPMIVTQKMSGGFVTLSCPGCNELSATRNLSRQAFDDLNVYVACGKCRRRAHPKMVGKNYGYRCGDCGWECELVSLVPSHEDVGPLSE